MFSQSCSFLAYRRDVFSEGAAGHHAPLQRHELKSLLFWQPMFYVLLLGLELGCARCRPTSDQCMK